MKVNRRLSTLWVWLIVSASLALAACAGGGLTPPAPSGGQVTSASKKSQLHVRVIIPKRFARHYKKWLEWRDKKGDHRTLSPEYVSASTTSLEFALNTVNGGAVPSGFTTPVYMNLASCANASGTYTCATAWTVPAGSDNFTVYACTGTNCGGSILSENALTQVVPTGSSNISITLYGVTNSITITAGNATYESGSSGAGFTVLGASEAWPFTVQAKDAAGNVITGAGAPTISASPANTNYTASVSGNTLNVTPKSTNGPISATAIKVIVTYPSGGATPYPGTCDGVTGTTCNVSFNLTTVLPAGMAVSDTNSSTVDIFSPQAVAMALAGTASVTASGTLSTGAGQPSSMAFDSTGDLFVGIGDGANGVKAYTKAQITSAVNGSTGLLASGSLKCGAGLSVTDIHMSPTAGTLWALQYVNSGLGNPSVCGYATTTLSSALGGASLATPDATLATANFQANDAGFGNGGGYYVLEAYHVTSCTPTCTTYQGTSLESWSAGKLSTAITSNSTNVASTGSISISTSLECGNTFSTPPPDACGSGNIDTAITAGLFFLGKVGHSACFSSPPPAASSSVTGTLNIGAGNYQASLDDDNAQDLFVGADSGASPLIYAFNSTKLGSCLTGSSNVASTGSTAVVNEPLNNLRYDTTLGTLNAAASSYVLTYYSDKITSLLAGSTGVTRDGYLYLGSGSQAWNIQLIP